METPEPVIIQANELFELTEKESLIFNLLEDVLRDSKLKYTELRVAGGWVRDKLLGEDCNDIDIAINDMLGKEFCKIIEEYLLKKGIYVKKADVIPSNSAKSKHLETAKMRLFGQCIDFVNLRTEEYGEVDRIPTMVKAKLSLQNRESRGLKTVDNAACGWGHSLRFSALQRVFARVISPSFLGQIKRVTYRWKAKITSFHLHLALYRYKSFGSPEKDAERRDLTINSMFYNIKTGSVEDFTGRGITDLKLGKIVTPLPPKQTFLDDPLRVLRAIRFCARFDFTLDEDLKKAAASDEVRDAIAEKISRERIGLEVNLMIAGNQPVKAVTYICDLQLFWTVFTLPSNVDPSTPEACDRSCLTFIDAAWSLVQSLESLTLSDDHRRLCLYSAMFLPLRSTTYKEKKKKPVPVVDHIFRNSLKLKDKDPETIINVHRVTEKFISIISLLTSQKDMQHAEATFETTLLNVPESSKLRILTVLLLREIKEFWPIALLVSTLVYPYGDLQESSTEGINLEKSRELFNLVNDMIAKQGLENIWETKPLINGNEIMSILKPEGKKVEGKKVGEWVEKVMQWQLYNPAGTVNECKEWLEKTGKELLEEEETGVKRARVS